MTVADNYAPAVFTGNGVTTVFPFSFVVYDESHLLVYEKVIATGVRTLISSANYTVSGVPGTGDVTYAPGGSPLSATKQLELVRLVPYTQALDIENQGGFFANTLEEQLDLTTMQIQQLADASADYLELAAAVEDAETAKTAAEAAQAAAEAAKTAAELAETNAEAAETAAEAARDVALTAQTAAETAETNAETAETNAETAATNASNSAIAAATSETNAAASAVAAQTAETNAETAETAAELAQTAAEAAQTAAEAAKTGAETAETNAETAETAAEAARDAALAAQTAAELAETNAETAATNANNSAIAAAASAVTASAEAAAAAISETNAATSEINAATSETNAGVSETNAAASAAAAQTAETNAETAETNAETAQTAAEAARDAAIAALASKMGTGFEGATGTIPNAQLPVRLQSGSYDTSITDWDLIVSTGTYSQYGALNQPVAGAAWWVVRVAAQSSNQVEQIAWPLNGLTMYRRINATGTWTAWEELLVTKSGQDARYAQLAAANTFTKAQTVATVALTDGATVALDLSLSNDFTLTLGGNRTLGNPTNRTVGQWFSITVTQDATGSRTLAYDTHYKFPGGPSAAPVLTTTASAYDTLTFRVKSATEVQFIGIEKAFG